MKNPAAGDYFTLGNYAIAEGAIAAGCRFYGGYPITPSSPIAERMSWRLPQVGGDFIQMEDEIASMASIVGASCGGKKAMTATSGPGISLMLENIGLAFMMEVPTVIVNVMRGGPSTGMPTLTSQGDIMQARYGSHGDYNIVVYAPSTVQECFDLTIKSFNIAEMVRTPVILLADQIVGMTTSNLHIPETVEIVDRPVPKEGDHYLSYDEKYIVPPMAIAGAGHRVHMTGLTHNEHGYPDAKPERQEKMMERLMHKYEHHAKDIIDLEEFMLDDAKYAIVSFGTESRSAKQAIRHLREKGIKVGMVRLRSIWPFPYDYIEELSTRVKNILVAEANLGQLFHPVREVVHCGVHQMTHAGGSIHTPRQISEKVMEMIQ